MFYIGLYRQNVKKIFLSETTRPGALMFGMLHHLVDLYQVCSNYTPRVKMAPSRGSNVLHRLTEEKREKIFLSETTGPRALIFDM